MNRFIFPTCFIKTVIQISDFKVLIDFNKGHKNTLISTYEKNQIVESRNNLWKSNKINLC